MNNKRLWLILILALPIGLFGCHKSAHRPGNKLERTGDEIVVCGQFFHTGAPVKLWLDPGGFDGYRMECRFTPDRMMPRDAAEHATPARFAGMRRHVPAEEQVRIQQNGWTLEELQKYVDLFVIHYDASGTSSRCFEILHDIRGLSVHFLLDLDGTIYQTLDLKERAWHAGAANDRSIGIEIANIGAYPDRRVLDEWYVQDARGKTTIRFPETLSPKHWARFRQSTFHPARPHVINGRVHGEYLLQYDLTNAQYESLIKLVATLSQALPLIQLDCPRENDGSVTWDVLSEDELAAWQGLVGHYHLTTNKVDPGPAFDWERVIEGARKSLR